jgi:two-component system, NarL family, response regulator LiaR
MSDGKIRVMIVDDHEMVRSGLATFLMIYSDMELVGQASNGAEALKLCGELSPDVVLMDLVMPAMDGAAATKSIRETFPHVQVIALTSFREEKLVQDVLQAGAIGFVFKNISADELAHAIRAAKEGQPTMAPEALQMLIHVRSQGPTPGHDLTSREREVLELMVEGLNNPDIADRLTVSRSTIKVHVSNILSKLGASSRTEAVALALQHHLVDQNQPHDR